MPCMIRRLTADGGLEPVDYAAGSLAEAVRFEPSDAVYTVTNTYHGTQVLKLDAHLDRLERSAERVHLPLALNRVQLRAALRGMIESAGYGDVRFRVTAPRSGGFLLSIEPFRGIAAGLIESGVRCVTVPNAIRIDPYAKTADWLHHRSDFVLPEGIYEGLLIDPDGYLLEGFSSNFYGMLDGRLHTAEAGVLPGIAQQVVLELAPQVIERGHGGVHVHDLVRVEEAFITSSSRGIVPVIEIDGVQIGAGRPGERTLRLLALYQAWVGRHLEEL